MLPRSASLFVGLSDASLMLIEVLLEANEDLPNILAGPKSARASEIELWYLSRNKGVSFSRSNSSTPTLT
jgi:hypothetical protein